MYGNAMFFVLRDADLLAQCASYAEAQDWILNN